MAKANFLMARRGLKGWTDLRRQLDDLAAPDAMPKIGGWNRVGDWWRGPGDNRGIDIAFPSDADATVAKLKVIP